MGLQTKEIRHYMESSITAGALRPEDIPELNLYVDQILTLFEDKFTQQGGEKGEKPLTKSMVNNYTKEKLILPVQGKKYTRFQVMQLLYIFHLKNTLSIGEIKGVTAALMEENCTSQQLEQILQAVPQSRNAAKQAAQGIADRIEEQYGQELSTVEAAEVLLEIAELSAALKGAAQAIAEGCFDFTGQGKNQKEGKKKQALPEEK